MTECTYYHTKSDRERMVFKEYCLEDDISPLASFKMLSFLETNSF